MTLRHNIRTALAALLVTVLAACGTVPPPKVQREGATPRVAQMPPGGFNADGSPRTEALPDDDGEARAQIRRGTGQVINRGAASAPPPSLGGTSGSATFNFEGEALQAVSRRSSATCSARTTDCTGVQGTVTLATPSR